MEAHMKKLLALSWAMPPMVFPRSIQVARVLKSLAGFDWDSTVVCANYRSIKGCHIDDSLGKLYEQCYTVRQVESDDYYSSYIKRAFSKVLPAFRPMPDNQRGWAESAVPVVKRMLADKKYSALITFAQPWSDHLLGLEISNQTDIPWVAHFSDPWVDSPYYQFTARQQKVVRQMEEDVIRKANAVMFVTSQTADKVMSKYPDEWQQKVYVIPHGYDAVGERYRSDSRAHKRLRMVHIGNFYPGIRTPERFLSALSNMNRSRSLSDKMEIVFYGYNTECYKPLADKLGLSEIVELSGPVTFEAAQQNAADADVLLAIDAPSRAPSLFLPSKLIEYLAFRKPILGLTPLSGASADLLCRLNCEVAAPDDVAGMTAAVERMLDLWRADKLRVTPQFDQVSKEYDIRNTARQMHNALCETIDCALHP